MSPLFSWINLTEDICVDGEAVIGVKLPSRASWQATMCMKAEQ